jgi:hypothetical protein
MIELDREPNRKSSPLSAAPASGSGPETAAADLKKEA